MTEGKYQDYQPIVISSSYDARRGRTMKSMLYFCDVCGVERVESRYPAVFHECFECRTEREVWEHFYAGLIAEGAD